jgi:3-oxoacyl-[acyl-carrier-protein] synthase II
MKARRVVVTGMGMVTPLGIGKEASWQRLIKGESGARVLDRFDASEYPVRIACQLPELECFKEAFGGRFCRTNDPVIQYGLLAADEAFKDAGFVDPLDDNEKPRFGVYLGLSFSGLSFFEQNHKALLESGPRRVSPYFIPSTVPNLAAGQVAIRFGLEGPSFAPVSACASGSHAIGEGFRDISRGYADVMFCGGTEAPITPIVVAGFAAMKALSKRNDEPTRASRPFDVNRDGFVLGEGAAVLVLEEYERARARGATIYAEVCGYSNTTDAHHISSPHPEGRGSSRCMKNAIEDAGWNPRDVQHVNAHGTSTRLNDSGETVAIKRVLGDQARNITVTANKSMLGHTMGAAGAIEAAITVLTLARGIIPPTINLDEPDPACDLDYVPHKARELSVDRALANSFGFGGANACLALARHSTDR